MGYSRAWGNRFVKKLNSKISWHCIFKTHPQYETTECAGNVPYSSMFIDVLEIGHRTKIRKKDHLFNAVGTASKTQPPARLLYCI